MSNLTDKLKFTALHHFKESKIEDPRAFKLMYNKVKTAYYKLTEEQKQEFLKAWKS